MFSMDGEDSADDLIMHDAAFHIYNAINGLTDNLIEMSEEFGGYGHDATRAWVRALICKAGQVCVEHRLDWSLDDFLKQAEAAYKYWQNQIPASLVESSQ